jgi:hypothetical protein
VRTTCSSIYFGCHIAANATVSEQNNICTYRLLLKEVVSCGILTGNSDGMHFSASLPLLTSRTYERCGQLVQWSLTHGGPGIPVLCPGVYNLMTGQCLTTDDVQYVSDTGRVHTLTKVSTTLSSRLSSRAKMLFVYFLNMAVPRWHNVSLFQMLASLTADEFHDVVMSESDWLADMGYCPTAVDFTQKENIVLTILEYELFTKFVAITHYLFCTDGLFVKYNSVPVRVNVVISIYCCQCLGGEFFFCKGRYNNTDVFNKKCVVGALQVFSNSQLAPPQ